MASSLFGWDLLYKSVESEVKSNQDLLVCFTHLVLVSNGFKCIGLGDSKNLDGDEVKSEVLPNGWTANYAIRYVFQGRLYNLRGTNLDDGVMINVIRVQERTVAMVQLNTRAVMQRTGSLEQMIPNSEELAQTIKKQLIDKIAVSTKYKDGTSQTPHDQERTLENSMPYPLPTSRFPERDILVPSRQPGNIGRSDLEPLGGLPGLFGGGGLGVQPGGMLFVPPRPPMVPPQLGVPFGSVPPGARFDPFRPPDVDGLNRPARRDNDEFLPPGFDDMYM